MMTKLEDDLRAWLEHQRKKQEKLLVLSIAYGWIAVSEAFREIAFLLFYRWYFYGKPPL
jgi:hypothetical protein